MLTKVTFLFIQIRTRKAYWRIALFTTCVGHAYFQPIQMHRPILHITNGCIALFTVRNTVSKHNEQ